LPAQVIFNEFADLFSVDVRPHRELASKNYRIFGRPKKNDQKWQEGSSRSGNV
jgi:hypothetical protein